MSNPITQLINDRPSLSSPAHEQKLDVLMRKFEDRVAKVIDNTSTRLLERYEGGLDESQRFKALTDFNSAKTKERVKTVMFDHYIQDGDGRRKIRGLQGDLMSIFHDAMYAVFQSEQRQIARAFNKGSSLNIKTSFTGNDARMLRKLIIGGYTLRGWLLLTLEDTYKRLSARMAQTIITMDTAAKMMLEMKRLVSNTVNALTKKMQEHLFELISYASNMANVEFMRALASV